MKITEEHLDFVASCIAQGEDVGPNEVRVDVSLIAERFGLSWPTARDVLQAAAKQLGHSMIGAKSTKVTKARKETARPPQPHEKALDAINSLMARRENAENSTSV